MEIFKDKVQVTDKITLGGNRMVLFAGPCAAESFDICFETGSKVKALCEKLGIDYVFKSSFDKANRTSSGSYRGPSKDEGLQILERVKKELHVPIVTDVHESYQCAEVATVADVLQIPAFLCRQTDLLKAAARTGKAVKVKKGQFMAPEDMKYAVDKVRGEGNEKVFLTERGVSFGYHTLVVDMRSLPVMRQYTPVILTLPTPFNSPVVKEAHREGNVNLRLFWHVQQQQQVLMDFIETHPNPEKALSDGPNMIPLHEMEAFLTMIKRYWDLGKNSFPS